MPINPVLDMIGLPFGELQCRRDEIDEGLQFTVMPLKRAFGVPLDEVEELCGWK